MKNPVLTLLSFAVSFPVWSMYVGLDLCPLVWMLGIAFEGENEGADVPGNVITLCVPTLRLEIRWAENAKLDAIQEKLDRAGLLKMEESPS